MALTVASEQLDQQASGRRLSATRELNMTKNHYYQRARGRELGVAHRPHLTPATAIEQRAAVLRQLTGSNEAPRQDTMIGIRHQQYLVAPRDTSTPLKSPATTVMGGNRQQRDTRQQVASQQVKTTSDNLSLNSAGSSNRSLESSLPLLERRLAAGADDRLQPAERPRFKLATGESSASSPQSTSLGDENEQTAEKFIHQNQIDRMTTTPNGSNELPLSSLSSRRQRHSATGQSKPTIEEQLRRLFNATEVAIVVPPDRFASPPKTAVDPLRCGRLDPLAGHCAGEVEPHKWPAPNGSPLCQSAGARLRANQAVRRHRISEQTTELGERLEQTQPRRKSTGEDDERDEAARRMLLFMVTSRRAAALTNTMADKEARILHWIHDCNRARHSTEWRDNKT